MAVVVTSAANARAQARAPEEPSAPPVVFFWSSASREDAQARGSLLAAIETEARRAGAQVVDLSPAAPPEPADAEKVARAIAAYDQMRFTDAIFELDQAAAGAIEQGGRGLGRDALVDLFLYRALARTETGDQTGAWSDFVRAATLDPARVLDPARFRPSAVKTFALAVKEVSARPAVELAVAAPPGSRVHLDGRPSGRDQVSETLRPGDHFVWVERPDAPPFAQTVTLAGATRIEVPEDRAAPPDDGELRRRAARLGAGAPLLVAVRRAGGAAVVELREIGPRAVALVGAIRLGPSPAASAKDLGATLRRELSRMSRERAGTSPVGPAVAVGPERRWYHNRWLWLGIGVAAGLAAASPFLLDRTDEPFSPGAVVPDPESAFER